MAPARTVKKVGKENAPPVMNRIENGKAASSEVQEVLNEVIAEKDRLQVQRDTLSKQFADLSNLRSSETEKLFETYKVKSETRAKTQTDLISNLTSINDKLKARVKALEKEMAKGTAGKDEVKEAAPVKADPKEIKALKERLATMEDKYKSKSKELEQLDKMYKDEVEHSKTLQASRSALNASTSGTAPAAAPVAATQDPSDVAIIRLYEDVTDLQIIDVKIKEGKYGPKDKEYTFNCVQTVGKKTAAFKLRAYTIISQPLLASKAANPYVKQFDFTPNWKGESDQELLKRLEDYSQPFSAPLSELGHMLESFKACVAEEQEEA